MSLAESFQPPAPREPWPVRPAEPQQIFGLLADVMHDLRSVAKRDRNEQQRFIFRGIDAVVNAVGPILRKHRVLVIPEVEQADYAMVKTSTGKDQMSCRLVVRYTFHAPDGSSLATRVASEASDSGDKATPKAMAVAFRTALLQALALPTDDPDPDAPKAPRNRAEGPPKDTPKEAETRAMSRPPRKDKTPREKQEGKMFALFTETKHTEKADMLGFIARVVGRDITSRTDIDDEELASVIAELQLEKSGPPPDDDAWASGSLPIDTDHA